jgi:hypothetical protein
MLVRHFRRPSCIEQLRSCSGGHLLEGFANQLSQGRYQWVAARKHIRVAEHFLHWIANRKVSITSVEVRLFSERPFTPPRPLACQFARRCLHL